MPEQGIYLAPPQFEAAFLSVSHTKEVIEKTIKALETVLFHPGDSKFSVETILIFLVLDYSGFIFP
jgi:hypothetical protein